MIQEVSFTQFKQMKARDIKESKSFAVTGDGIFLFFVVVPQTDYIRHAVEELMILGNSVGGKEVKDASSV
jgi:hypothetical protein